MSGFDDGSSDSAFAQAKQLGSILRGVGPPVPQAGVVGDLYLDVQTWFLYERRSTNATDPWGHYLWAVPATYQSALKWFSSSPPTNDIGVNGDYCLLWAGFNNYGLQPSICGPKANGCWPESGDGPGLLLSATNAGFSVPQGLLDRGTAVAFSNSWQLVVVGLDTEYILAIPVPQLPNTPSTEIGLASSPLAVSVNLDPAYTAIDGHAV